MCVYSRPTNAPVVVPSNCVHQTTTAAAVAWRLLSRICCHRPATEAAMAFFKRVMDHLLNQVLVETLANSKWFQRFAVNTHRLTKEAAEKGEGVLPMQF